jgi:hypothetical protein
MDVEELLKDALEGGLTVERRGSQLVVRGMIASEKLAHRVLSHKSEVMAALDRGREVIHAMKADDFKMFAIGFNQLRVTPQPDEGRRAALVPLKMALITILRAETSSVLQTFHDLDEELVANAVADDGSGSEAAKDADAGQDAESGSHVTNADWEGVMNSVHVRGSRGPHCYEVGIAWDYKPYLPPHPGDEEEKEETGEENDATSPAAPVAPAVT